MCVLLVCVVGVMDVVLLYYFNVCRFWYLLGFGMGIMLSSFHVCRILLFDALMYGVAACMPELFTYYERK